MPKIKLEHVVSCSSEDPVHVASNLLNNDTTKKWKSKTVGESAVTVIFQLEKASKITGIDIGNENSSFVEVFVGRSSSQESDYQILLAMSSFMTPMEARNVTNNNRVRLFTAKDLADSARNEKWDRVKVVCTQPFNKHIQFGLSFLTLHAPQDTKTEDPPSNSLGKFTLRAESPNFLTAGSLFARRKELANQKESEKIPVAQEIKQSSSTPKCKPTKIHTPSTSSAIKNSDTDQKNRNRKGLFYDSDDEVCNEKIDKVIEKARLEEEKKKKDVRKVTPSKTVRKTKEPEEKLKDEKVATPKQNSAKKTKTSNDVTPSSASSSKRKLDTTPKVPSKKKKKFETRPFNELMKGVVFTISGIVNPERANVRQLALNMGARYRPDWDSTCTHLICAFANTPKFQQVQGKGKIITKNWILDSHSQRKRLPWRRFALDRNDQGKPESEDEICEKTNEAEEEEISDEPMETETKESDEQRNVFDEKTKEDSPVAKINHNDYLSGSDTDDEIEKILKKQRAEAESSSAVVSNGDNNIFNVDTEEEKLEKNPADVEDEIPKIFKTEIFYIDDVLSEAEKNKLERLIKALNGVVLTRISNILDFVVTNKESVDNIKDRCSNAKFVSPLWIYECNDMQTLVPIEKFVLV